MKKGFTLAEVNCSAPNGEVRRGISRRAAFTLAEVLIALLIIGIVAALTLPSFIHNITEKANATKVAVFNSKFIQSLNSAKAAGELNNTYTDTYDFVKNGLSHHMRMTTICGKDHLEKCLGYDTITYENKQGKEQTKKLASLKTAKSINVKDAGFKDTAAFLMADGTPVLLTYNIQCTTDGGADKTISPCVAGLFDINGSRKPNMFLNKIENGKSETKDIRSFNGASPYRCVGEIDDMCLLSTALGGSEGAYNQMFEAVKNNRTNQDIPSCTGRDDGLLHHDYRQIAEEYCTYNLEGKMVSQKQLSQIATALYGTNIPSDSYYFKSVTGITMKNKDTLYDILGIPISANEFRIGIKKYGNGNCGLNTWFFKSTNTYYDGDPGGVASSSFFAICVE